MKFPYLLFDADDTLFDFPKAAARAFSAMCRSNGVPDTLDTRALYHRINQELWAAFDRGEVSKDYVTLERFVRFFQALKLPRDPDKCNRDYLTALGAGVYPLPHAEAVCRELVRGGTSCTSSPTLWPPSSAAACRAVCSQLSSRTPLFPRTPEPPSRTRLIMPMSAPAYPA